MKRNVSVGLAAIMTLVLGGCGGTTVSGPRGSKLTLLQPASQTLRRGETNRVAITVVRENIDSDITLRFLELPKGVKIIEADRSMKSGEIVVNYTLHAANDAGLVANHAAQVKAEGPNGISATEMLLLTIKD